MPLPAVLDPADPRPSVREALAAWLAVQRAFALRPVDAAEALRRFGEPGPLLREAQIPVRGPSLEPALHALRRAGAVALPLLSPAYPDRLVRLADPPCLLLVRGDPAQLHRPSVAIVGARAPSATGRAVARRFGQEMARAGVPVVSGLALGIDAAAHGAALDAGGNTVAVQACGPDLVYPARHRGLAARIVEAGALVTEFPPGTPPRPYHFPLRNRLISALSHAVLVVEARERSGSLVTARHAADQGIDVFAIPGPVDLPTSAGTNRLLRSGAGVALEPADILDELRRTGALRAGAPTGPAPRRAEHREAGEIVAALLREPASRDELARRLARSPEALAVELLELELAGRIAEDRDGRLRVLPGGA